MKIDSSLLVIPTYNCENQIAKVLNKLNDVGIENYFSHVLLIDNCSTDSTVLIATRFKQKTLLKWLSIAKNETNYGLGGTHKVAVKYCLENNLKSFGVIHGDDQANIQDLLGNIHLFGSKDETSAFLGARFMPTSRLVGYSRVRIFGNIILNFIMTAVSRKRIYDMGSGLNFFIVKDLLAVDIFRLPDDLTFNNQLILSYVAEKKSLLFFPITWTESGQVSNAKLWNQGFKVLGMCFKFLLFQSISKQKITKSYDYEILNV
jgi:glycosyltransferase involved in cell wall biosynthesis